ncbi:Lipid A export ATP-binding permease protein MsbA [Mesoplasma florum W37]|uniref:Lipid A export ATP-binding permease protein MsbA n=1 Tax=Mesoplasma florum TaxID=2151 RepID=A0AAD0HSJ5_MESFO|nr:ABC transporter ATP-binding protein [Mesoplasma florum]AGY41630.1 Lipid A export ATP-binding permease protein MsbA [Mesoplasma florum W37]AVN59838.1 ABC transporter ATP-binding protein [Mesoplasma florum]AVN65968.1 Lipid A export ATP-binding permease protein MsbA [Mesoplasma florum]
MIDREEQEMLDNEKINESSTPQVRVSRWLKKSDLNTELEPTKSKKKSKSYIALILRYMGKNKMWTFLMLVSVLILSVATAMTPKIIEQMSAAVVVEKYKEAVEGSELWERYSQALAKWWGVNFTGLLWIEMGIVIAMAIATFVSQWTAGMLGKKIEVDLRNDLNKKLVSMDMSYYSDKKIGEILTKVVSDTQIIGEQTGIIPITFLNGILTTIAAIIVMSTISGSLTIVLMCVFLTLFLIFFILFIPMKPIAYKTRKIVTEVNGDVTDRINNVKLIKASGTEEYEENRFIEKHIPYFKQSSLMNYYQAIVLSLIFLIINAIETVMIIATVLIYDSNQVVAVLPGMISASSLMIGPLMSFLRVLVGLTQSNVASKRIGEILEQEPRFDNHFEDKNGVIVEKIKGNIYFKDVAFAYPEKPTELVLPKFDFTFEQGKSYAFVGTTGAGKSTISKLLLRFYDPTIGQVLINEDIDLKDVVLSSYLDKVGYVEQEPAIFLGNVYDNVRYGRFEATNKQVIAACKKAELHDLIMTWPDGYDTILGERGFMLSGGQKQRLVIARMFLKDPQLLILDEATSALDNIVEKEIQAKLNELMKGRTSVTIAHRLSTIKNVDEILVLAPKQGIVQRGTFNELKKIPGHFKDLYDAGNSKKDGKEVTNNEQQ